MTPASPKAPAAATRTQKTKASTAAKAKAKPAAKPVVKQLKVTLAATQGDCWLAVRTGSKDGKLVYTGTLVKGKSLDVSAKSLWIRFGAPQNVQLTVNGDGASIPTSSQDVVITRNGIQAAPA
jgi:hypothetical protein